MNELEPQVIFLMGPTASGKTDLAIRMCQHFPVEVISVDSALIYQGMDVGTAKPTQQELQQAPHRLINIVDPALRYSVADFRHDALQAIKEIRQGGKVPLLVGGTMLYFRALLEGLSVLPEADQNIRMQIEQQAQTAGWGQLHAELQEIDPISAARIHPNDPQRLTRAIEVYRITGKSLTELSQSQGEKFPYSVKQYALLPDDRAILHQRIAQRFHQMMADGFEKEVQALYEREDLHADLPAMRCVGYRQIWEYLQGNITQQVAIERGIIATRQLAKRQMTWLRGWPNVTYLSCEKPDEAFSLLSQPWSSY